MVAIVVKAETSVETLLIAIDRDHKTEYGVLVEGSRFGRRCRIERAVQELARWMHWTEGPVWSRNFQHAPPSASRASHSPDASRCNPPINRQGSRAMIPSEG